MAITAATAPTTLIRDFMSLIDDQIIGFASSGAASAAHALTPVIISLLVATTIAWLILVAFGQIEGTLWDGLRRFTRIVIVTTVALNAAHYNLFIVQLAFAIPDQVAGLFITGSSTTSLLDTALWHGDTLAVAYKDQGSGLSVLPWFLMAVGIWIITVIMVVIGAALLALTHFFLGLVIALGPFFICTLYWKGPRDFFTLWLKQVVTLFLTYVLAVMAISLTLRMWEPTLTAASGTVSNGMTSLVPVFVIGGIGILAMRQVNMIARGLGGGWHLDLMHALSAVGGFAWGATKATGRSIDRSTERRLERREERIRERNERNPPDPVSDYHHHHRHHGPNHGDPIDFTTDLDRPDEPPPRDDRPDFPNEHNYN
jgi:type IV secretory pathway VirB6-like protein